MGSLSYYFIASSFFATNYILLFLIFGFTILGTWATKILEKEWGHDPSRIVIDETIGQWITYLFIPFKLKYLLIGLVLFRIFDIAKPFGIRAIDEKMDNSFSVILDDIIAGIYALISLQVIIYLW